MKRFLFAKEFRYEHNFDYYHIIKNGNQFICASKYKKACIRKCEKMAEKGDYIELWYYYSPGQRMIINYWN